MVELDRINYRDLYSSLADYIDYSPLRHSDAPQQQACAAPVQNAQVSILSMPAQSRMKTMVKNVVKRTPLGRIIISNRKRKYIRDIFSNENKPTLDLSVLMGFADDTFIEEIFEILLGREVSRDEYMKFYSMLKFGMPKEALVYILCNSPEKDPNIAVESFYYFEKAYFGYLYKQKIINLPVLNYILALIVLPMRLRKIDKAMTLLSIDAVDKSNAQLHSVQTAEKNIINYMKER